MATQQVLKLQRAEFYPWRLWPYPCRLELIAAFIPVRLISTVREALSPVINIEKIFRWTICYPVGQFVQNRISEIMKLSDANNWRHCAGNNNPVDIGSRGCLQSDLGNNALWWNGCIWLKESPQHYPISEKMDETTELSEGLKELRIKRRTATTTTTTN